jgi:hypothetical protein
VVMESIANAVDVQKNVVDHAVVFALRFRAAIFAAFLASAR